MDKEHNSQDRPGVSTGARSTLAPIDQQGVPLAPNKEPNKTSKLPRVTSAQQAMAHSDDPRPSPGMLRPGGDVAGEQGKVPTPMGPHQNPSHQLTSYVGIHNSPI
ncbi:hypothetical protein LIER_40928 [Lithospermum erythrorhizon]|uniref:Uncharacterized protein n=1 Tax=Lithospermum erythrorhizon TaxID=34254 RepID=A0AAV3R2W0_LITER